MSPIAVISLDPGTLEGFGLYLVRSGALVLAAPVLGMASGVSSYKIALIFTLSAVLFISAGSPAVPEVDVMPYAAMAARELLLGFFLAFLAQLAVLSVRVAGSMVGHEMGFAMSEQVDPESGIRSPLVTRIYETLFLFGLLSVDGHHWLLRALQESFARAPVGKLELRADVTETVIILFAEMFGAGLSFAAPVMVLLFLVSILIGLLSRAVPQLNVLEIGFTLRIAFALFALLLFSPLLGPAMDQVYDALFRSLDMALDALGS